MFFRLSAALTISFFIALVTACAPTEPLTVEDPRIRELTPGRTTTAAYFTLRNQSNAAVTLIGAEAPGASSIEMHTLIEREDGRVGMRRVPEVSVDPGSSVDFAPGGLHLMVFGVERLDEPFPVELIFADGRRMPAAFAKLSLVPGSTTE